MKYYKWTIVVALVVISAPIAFYYFQVKLPDKTGAGRLVGTTGVWGCPPHPPLSNDPDTNQHVRRAT